MMFCCATAFAQNVIHIELENSINRDNKFGNPMSLYRIYNLDTGEKTWEETSIEQRLFYRLSSGLFSSRTDCLPLEYCICKSGYNVLAHHGFTKPTRLVNPETNKKIYSKAITPFFIDSEKDILIGTASDYTVYAYRLSTGKWLWECKIKKSELEVVNNVIVERNVQKMDRAYGVIAHAADKLGWVKICCTRNGEMRSIEEIAEDILKVIHLLFYFLYRL